MKRLRDVEAPLANFFGSGVLASGRSSTGAGQLPERLEYDAELLAAFFRLLPRSMGRSPPSPAVTTPSCPRTAP